MSFFRVDQSYMFSSEFKHRNFISIINELFLEEKRSWYDTIDYLNKEHDAIVFDSDGYVIFCLIKLGGPYWLSIDDTSYVLYSSSVIGELNYDDSVLILQGDYCET